MSARPIGPILGCLRRLVAAPDADTSDARLLRRFVSERDESAFELLVWRHGAMVHGLCRRLLRDHHDADDAFQATLLVLARKAGSIGQHESVASWLYKVAYRVALRARDAALRRTRHERQVGDLPAVSDPHAAADPGWEELRPVLDEELSRLAEKYRVPVVLCYLEGLTNEEAARQLACPVGTVKTRLAQARRQLAEQLTRRGLALAAASVLGGALPAGGAAPAAALVGVTVRAAVLAAAAKVLGDGVVSASVAQLMEGVLQAMLVTKLKWAAALVLGLALAGVGGVTLSALAGAPPAEKPATPAEVRVKQLKAQIADLDGQLAKAEEDAAREKAVPPRDKPIAILFDNVPVTRDELADYLLARMTTGQLDRYLNRRILEHAARAKGIHVTAAEMDAHVKEEMKRIGLTEQAFREQVLGKQRLTLQEWKEDVARPSLLLKKLAATAHVSDADLRAAFEARYAEKVECRVMALPTKDRAAAECAVARVRSGKVTFEKEAQRWQPGSSPRTVPISRGDPKGNSEPAVKAAWALRPGQISDPIDYGGGFIILECVRYIPQDTTVRLEDVRKSCASTWPNATAAVSFDLANGQANRWQMALPSKELRRTW